MGNLLGGVSFREPTTVEDCDSTWQTDSEPEPEEPGPGGDEGPGREPEQPAQSPERAGGRPRASPAPDRDAQAAGAEQGGDSTEATAKPKRSFYAARDLYKYRHQYPQNFKDIRYQNDLSNLRFYKNKIPFKPDGVYIEEVLNKWKGDYETLEHNHTYIQWLFPLREQGLNFYAKELTTYEIEEFKKTKEAIRRFLLAYKMMLEFFGIKLIDKTGNVARAVNWQERFQHLNETPSTISFEDLGICKMLERPLGPEVWLAAWPSRHGKELPGLATSLEQETEETMPQRPPPRRYFTEEKSQRS